MRILTKNLSLVCICLNESFGINFKDSYDNVIMSKFRYSIAFWENCDTVYSCRNKLKNESLYPNTYL